MQIHTRQGHIHYGANGVMLVLLGKIEVSFNLQIATVNATLSEWLSAFAPYWRKEPADAIWGLWIVTIFMDLVEGWETIGRLGWVLSMNGAGSLGNLLQGTWKTRGKAPGWAWVFATRRFSNIIASPSGFWDDWIHTRALEEWQEILSRSHTFKNRHIHLFIQSGDFVSSQSFNAATSESSVDGAEAVGAVFFGVSVSGNGAFPLGTWLPIAYKQ